MNAHTHGASHDHSAHNNRELPDALTDPVEFWEGRYGSAERVWSGRVNGTLADLVGDWSPGSSLDLGSGEGGDVLWLAERGWRATGIDLSATAIARAQRAAAGSTFAGTESAFAGATFIAADLGDWVDDPASIDRSDEPFDLVTASFFQSPVALPRERILRAAANRVADGGALVIIAHAAAPEWSEHHDAEFPTPAEELATLELSPHEWVVDVAEVREREALGPNGTPTLLLDSVVVARRKRN